MKNQLKIFIQTNLISMRWVHLQTFELYFPILFRNWSIFIWTEKSNVALVIQKSDKELLTNYCSILILAIIDKSFEILLCTQMFEFFNRNKSISEDQSGLKPVDYFINQLLSITHENYKSFGNCIDLRAVISPKHSTKFGTMFSFTS